MKQILEIDGANFTTTWMYLMLLNYTLKMAKTADFMLSTPYHKKKKKKREIEKEKTTWESATV